MAELSGSRPDSAWPPAATAIGADIIARARRVERALRVRDTVNLGAIDPRSTPGLPRRVTTDPARKAWSRAEVARLGAALRDYQERLYASAAVATDRRRLLLVLQAMDCGGKDGTIKSVVGAMNPLGVRIKAFGAPTAEELAHHFLWRVQTALPACGYVGVFNRSHYEDVLAARVRSSMAAGIWRGRFDEINEFEHTQVRDGMTLVKVMLHISYAEQRKRLLARLADPTKRWKFKPGDIDDRALWPDYRAAYQDVLAKCSSSAAPWYVVPADRKWYRNWAVANILLAHLHGMSLTHPAVDFDVAQQRQRLERESQQQMNSW